MNDIQPQQMALLIPILSVIFAGAILLTGITLRHFQRNKFLQGLQQERLALVDKGLPLPPIPSGLFSASAPLTPVRMLLRGLVWLFIALGFMVALYEEGRREFLYTLVPVGIGLAYLICYFAEGRKSIQPPAPLEPPSLPLTAKA